MKNLSTRTKLLLAIAGVVIVVVLAGVVLVGPGEINLFGATTLVITPSNFTMTTNNTYVFSANAGSACNWFSSDHNVVMLLSPYTETKSVQVIALNEGSATLEAHCGVFKTNHVSTVVTTYNPWLHMK